ncbi:hypothetical protein [Chlorobium limicola]|uniref:Uncharacterized protein n=1 Tax=Chlorobium limicola TaxID=1092 RepID=A0A117MS54_CHLLI|nr:hypothetical protein [Chlorobium limicola]KUL32784.1 hypothetical protein ASB62_01410 [Chlorobium limicola]
MKRIVIIGSKPNANIPDGDVIYCANGAIGYYAENVKRFGKVISILNPDLIHPKKRKNGSSTKEFYERQWLAIVHSRPDKVILLRNNGLLMLTEALRDAGFEAPVLGLSRVERRMLVGRISGSYDPIITKEFFLLPVGKKIRYIGSLCSTYLKRIIDKKKDCGAYFRPSTGVISLIFAIDEYGNDAEYVVAGIGIKNRAQYHDGNNPAQNDLPHHVFADKQVLRRLAGRYRLYTTEQELMPYIPPWNHRS